MSLFNEDSTQTRKLFIILKKEFRKLELLTFQNDIYPYIDITGHYKYGSWLHFMVNYEASPEIMRFLINQIEANFETNQDFIDEKNSKGESALDTAFRKGRHKLCLELLKSGASINNMPEKPQYTFFGAYRHLYSKIPAARKVINFVKSREALSQQNEQEGQPTKSWTTRLISFCFSFGTGPSQSTDATTPSNEVEPKPKKTL